jgi:uncharacterized protein (TIGR02646 family)
MYPFTRQPAPSILQERADFWNAQWAALKSRNPGASFIWYQHDGVPVNQKLGPILSAQTQEHCSYCDAYPQRSADDTIDHFKPKSIEAFYHLAFDWHNLYIACADCQKNKGAQYSDLLLRPDDREYTFEQYFIYNYNNHLIEPNPRASEADQEKARTTIQILNLNQLGLVTTRRHSAERWYNATAEGRMLDDFPFRFLFL